MHILDQYRDVDKDLEEVRQGKIDKVRQFYQSRFNTNASKSSLHKGGVGIFDNAKLSLSVESIQMDDNGLQQPDNDYEEADIIKIQTLGDSSSHLKESRFGGKFVLGGQTS